MKNALILHGTNGTSAHNWFPWLEEQLTGKGWKVWVPDLPGAEAPNIRRYKDFIFSSDWKFDSDSVIVGHSSGSVAILGILQALQENVVIDHAVLVGSFMDDLDRDDLKGLFEEPFDFDKIKSRARKFTFLHSDNDPYCPLEHAERLSQLLDGELIIQKGSEHFSMSAGGERFKELPILLNILGIE